VTADVPAAIEAAIREGIARAEAAGAESPIGMWFSADYLTSDGFGPGEAMHIAAHSPADALRAYHADLELLAWAAHPATRHEEWRILIYDNLARRYNVPTEETP
jgi:hypothetical protein